MKLLALIIMFISFWYSALPLSELHQHAQEQEVATEHCCEHEDDQTACHDDKETSHHNHGDHDCTPQCHCKCFSPHYVINVSETDNIISEIDALFNAKPIAFIHSDYSLNIFQPPRFI